ncbi:MAG: hypothetical protein AAF939_14795 [Planctomycetota bacterium]
MKQELTFAAALLAIGFYLLSGSDIAEWTLLTPSTRSSQPTFQRSPDDQAVSSWIQPASFQNPNPDDSDSNFHSLERIAKGLANHAIPFQCQVKLTGVMLETPVVAQGYYLQKGQGTGKSRLQFRFDHSGTKPTELFQLCDGRFHFSLMTSGSTKELTYVDVDKLKKQQASNPIQLIGAGGLEGMLSQLQECYQFESPRRLLEGKYEFTGTLKTETQTMLNYSQTEQISKRIPSAVNVLITQHPQLGWLPAKIEYSFPGSANHQANPKLQPFLKLSFGNHVKAENLADDLFIIRTNNLESVDHTEAYLAQLEQIENARLAKLDQSNAQNIER